MRAVLITSLLLIGAAAVGNIQQGQAADDGAAPVWWTTTALEKVRPGDRPPASPAQTARVFAARNEFEPFQIVVRAQRRALTNVDVDISDLSDGAGHTISRDNFIVYLERYLNVTKPSLSNGTTGEWPDPLIPRRDRYMRERRNGFPFPVYAGRNQPIWVELYVPPETPPGTYEGKATITGSSFEPISVPVRLTVWNFKLPSTSTFPTTFGFNGITALKQHRGEYTSDDELRAFTFLYQKAALWHRISIHGGTLAPPTFTGNAAQMQIQWKPYDAEVAPFMNGTAIRRGEPLYGAKATTIDLRISGNASSPADKIAYWREWTKHFEQNNWLNRLFYYVWDEPTKNDLPKIQERANLAHQADPRIKVLVTTSLSARIAKVIDIWTPLINCMDKKPGFPDYCENPVARSAYNAEMAAGRKLWWYQSCGSHGCNVAGNEYFNGWPSYMIDAPGISNRIFQWLAWKYGIQGELYYNLNETYDPWTEFRQHGGNGDGVLIYPGRPDRIGGKSHIPIESIRLKLIREGLEDYEYLNLSSNTGLQSCIDQLLPQLLKTTYDWKADPKLLYGIRRQLGEALGGAARSTGASTRPRSCSAASD